MPPLRLSAALRLSLALITLAACSKAREIEANAETAPCARCHGGGENATGAPPKGLFGATATTDLGVGAHSVHVQGGALGGAALACTSCHPDPRYGSSQHMNGTRDVAFGGLATTGLSAAPVWNRGAATCSSTYCHGGFTGGNAANTPVWTTVNGTQAACGTCHGLPPPGPHPTVTGGTPACNECHGTTVDAAGAIVPLSAGGTHLDGRLQIAGVHDAAWMDTASATFHARSADDGLAACQRCHGADLSGGFAGVACSSCHTTGGPAPVLSCTGCHGGIDNATGAPPRARWADRTDPLRIGAHTKHVSGGDLAPAFSCDVCHLTPATMFTPGHVDASPAEVVFGGLAVADGASAAGWDRGTATCSSTYCHGATLGGGGHTQPDWTKVGQGETACGSCHGLPPPAPHPAVPGGIRDCNACHPGTVDATGAVIPPSSGGLHLDGTAEWASGHPDAFKSDPSSPGFHAVVANQGLATCQLCHGTNLDGVGGLTNVACANCHTGTAAPVLSCTGCHGGTDNATGAPPRVQWAARGDTGEAALRTGAHTKHVTGDAIVPAFDCDVCHVKPASMFTNGHITSATSAEVTFGGLATTRLPTAPTWDRAAPSCAVYCHGATLHGGTNTTPSWTGGASQAACGTCHGIPPNGPHPTVSADLPGCHDCHPKTIDASGALIPRASGGKHVDGQIDGGHLPAWMDVNGTEFHAYSANRNLETCRLCHGQSLEGAGDAPACATCHTAGGDAAALTCTGCHGGTDNQTGAPPKARWGNRSSTVPDVTRIGAHSAHVWSNTVSARVDCAECHVKPATPFDAGHIGGVRATVVFQGPVSGLKTATWNYPVTGAATCASTYCHGNFTRGSNATPDWNGTSQAACGTCHPARPAAYLHQRHQRDYSSGVEWWPQPGQSGWITCDQCHSGIASSVDNLTPPALTLSNGVGPALHVNGTTDVVFKLGGTYTKAPGEGTCSSLACHPGQTMFWPR